MVATSLPMLRAWLLDDRLLAFGLVDRERLNAALSEDELMWHGRCGEIMNLCWLEDWVGAWEARLRRANPSDGGDFRGGLAFWLRHPLTLA